MTRKRKQSDRQSFWGEYRKLLFTALPVLLALLIMILVGYLWRGPLSPPMLSLIFIVAGFTGVIVAIRREFPAVFFTIRGLPAVLAGGLLTVLLWGAALYVLLQGL